jgi:hypothetical protein
MSPYVASDAFGRGRADGASRGAPITAAPSPPGEGPSTSGLEDVEILAKIFYQITHDLRPEFYFLDLFQLSQMKVATTYAPRENQ